MTFNKLFLFIPLIAFFFNASWCQVPAIRPFFTENTFSDTSMTLGKRLSIPRIKIISPDIKAYIETYSEKIADSSIRNPEGYTSFIMAEMVYTEEDTLVQFITQGCCDKGMLEYLNIVELKDGNVLRGGFVYKNILFLLTTPSGEDSDCLFQYADEFVHVPVFEPNVGSANNTMPIVFLEIIDIVNDSVRNQRQEDILDRK